MRGDINIRAVVKAFGIVKTFSNVSFLIEDMNRVLNRSEADIGYCLKNRELLRPREEDITGCPKHRRSIINFREKHLKRLEIHNKTTAHLTN